MTSLYNIIDKIEFYSNVMMILMIITWVSFVALAGWIAQDKGRDPVGFMAAAFLFPLAGVIAACAARTLPQVDPSGASQSRYEQYQRERQATIRANG